MILTGSAVVVKRLKRDGSTIELSLERLSAGDQQWGADQARRKKK
jgi:hypothetical protein